MLAQYLAFLYAPVENEDFSVIGFTSKPRRERGLPEVKARLLLQRLLTAWLFAHERGVANRDVKVLHTLLPLDNGSVSVSQPAGQPASQPASLG